MPGGPGTAQPNPIAGAIGGAVGAAAGAFPTSARGSTQSGTSATTESNQSSNSSSNSSIQQLLNYLQQLSGSTTATQTTSPNLNPTSQAYINQLLGKFSGMQAPSLTGYVAGQTANINNNAQAQEQAVANIMASRGLSTSPAAATAQAGIEQNRLNQITGVEQQAPITLDQLQLENLAPQISLAGLLPGLSGSTTAGGTTTQQSTNTQQQMSQEQQQQSWQNLWNWLSQLSSTNQTWNQNSGGGIGGLLSGLAGVGLSAAAAFSDKKLKKEIRPIDKAINKIHALKPRTWKWKGGQVDDAGFIAQDIEKILPELVHEDTSRGPIALKKVNYFGMMPYIVKALQEIDKKVEALA